MNVPEMMTPLKEIWIIPHSVGHEPRTNKDVL